MGVDVRLSICDSSLVFRSVNLEHRLNTGRERGGCMTVRLLPIAFRIVPYRPRMMHPSNEAMLLISHDYPNQPG